MLCEKNNQIELCHEEIIGVMTILVNKVFQNTKITPLCYLNHDIICPDILFYKTQKSIYPSIKLVYFNIYYFIFFFFFQKK